MLSRRAVLRSGLASVVGVAWPSDRRLGPDVVRATRWSDGALTCDLSGATLLVTSPALRGEPFSRALPRPPVVGSGGVASLTIGTAEVELLSGVGTPMLTYDGVFPGPTLAPGPGRGLELTVRNGLDEGAVLHLHGAHTASEHDGHVRDVIPPGGERVHVHDDLQRPATLWYHDHLLMRTADRVFRGLAGCYVLADPAERDLGLPVGGDHDVVVMLTDKSFESDGTLQRQDGSHAPRLGDVLLVNGADRPRLDVTPGLLRLRLVNASNARAFRLVRTDGEPLVQVASDGGLLAAPAVRDRIEVWPAERVEVVLDLSDVPVGTRVHLADAAGPAEDAAVGFLRIEVVAPTGGTGTGPLAAAFEPLEALDPPVVTRTIELGLAPDGRFVLNGHGYGDDVRDVFARLGAVERWRLVNATAVAHPMHLHLVSFLVRAREDAQGRQLALRAEDEGWKDVVLVPGMQTVEIDARFDDHLGDFMYHCHILEHEDHDMMSQFRVVDLARLAGGNRFGTSAAVAASLPGPRGDVVVAGGNDWPGALAGAAVADALLLVGDDALDMAVEAELRRVPPSRIVVVGEVADHVVDAIRAHAPTLVVRGTDPVDTVAQVAEQLVGRSDRAVVATDVVFADALAAGLLGVPVLLTDPSSLSASTERALRSLGVVEVVIAGGTAAVGPAVEAQLRTVVADVQRIWGGDRTGTAAAFSRHAGLRPTCYVASASRFPDALGAALAARRSGASLALLDDAGPSPATAALMADGAVGRVRIVGGEAAVPLVAEHRLAALMQVG